MVKPYSYSYIGTLIFEKYIFVLSDFVNNCYSNNIVYIYSYYENINYSDKSLRATLFLL